MLLSPSYQHYSIAPSFTSRELEPIKEELHRKLNPLTTGTNFSVGIAIVSKQDGIKVTVNNSSDLNTLKGSVGRVNGITVKDQEEGLYTYQPDDGSKNQVTVQVAYAPRAVAGG